MLHKVRAETTGSISHGMLQYEQQITKYTDEQQKYMMVLFWFSLTLASLSELRIPTP
jgi:hypothetical protein